MAERPPPAERPICKAWDLAVSGHDTPQITLPRSDDTAPSRYAKICGKASRFLARNIVTKKLLMHNAKPLVTFTFDDAPASACTTGARLLQQYQARGTFYISGGGCGIAGFCGRLATAEQVKGLCADGHEIGCHTYSHTAVVSIGQHALADELERNRVFLHGLHGDLRVSNFAYPYGKLSFRTKRYLEARFDSCRSVTPGVNAGAIDLGALKSYSLENASIDRRGIAEIVAETVRSNGWLIFASHDVDNAPSRYGVSPDLFAFALQAARQAGCHLATVRDALRILNGGVDAHSG